MGKLGKPQKSKKHKKMKNTFDSQSTNDGDFSIGSGRNKMQNLPVREEDLDKQDMPRKLKDIIHMKNNPQTQCEKKKVKHNKKKKLKKAAESNLLLNHGAKKQIRPIPRLVQGKHEKDQKFMRRVEMEAHKVIMQSQMEKKYGIKFTATGSNAKLTTDLFKKKSSKKKREKDKERKKQKVEAKKEKKRDRKGDFSSFKDDVAFGEVAMAPPSLTAKPRKAIENMGKPRPGKRSLLLKDMISTPQDNDSSDSNNKPDHVIKNHPKSQAQRLAGQTIKRKYLSPVQKQITDFQRQKAIDLYRRMKERKIKPTF